jgi:hypothetical protein
MVEFDALTYVAAILLVATVGWIAVAHLRRSRQKAKGDFVMERCLGDGRLLESRSWAYSELSNRWLAVCADIIESHGPILSVDLGDTLAGYKFECTAGFCRFSVGGELLFAGVLLPPSVPSQNEALLKILATKTGRTFTPESPARPLYLVVDYGNAKAPQVDRDAMFELSYHFAAAYFRWCAASPAMAGEGPAAAPAQGNAPTSTGGLSRLASRTPDIAQAIDRARPSVAQRCAEAAARLALERVGLPGLESKCLEELDALVESYDEEYFEAGDDEEKESRAFERARGASAMAFAKRGAADEAIYEAIIATDDEDAIRALVTGIIGKG